MAYTRDWDTEVLGKPLGSRNSDEIDDAIREFKVDLDERFRDILYDVDADPWKIKVPGVAVDGTSTLRITPPLGVLFLNLAFDIGSFDVKPTAVSVGGVWMCSIPIDRGSTIKGVTFRVIRATAGATVTCKLVKVDTLGVMTVVASQGAAVLAGPQSVNLGALTEQITDLADYGLVVEITADGAAVINSVLRSVAVNYLVAGV